MTSAVVRAGAATMPVTTRWLLSLVPSGSGSGRELVSVEGMSLLLQLEGPGSAPETSVGAGTAVLIEGRLYDRDELAAALSVPATAGDAELVRHAFERWGARAVDRIAGQYALCFWDAHRRTLLAARDRTGACPLFFRYRSGRLHISTFPSAVAAAEGPAEIDRNVVAAIVARAAPEVEETCYRHVKRLPAGHLLTVDSAGKRCVRYWRPEPVGNGAGWMTEDEVRTFPQLLDRVVGRALDRGRGGIFLSGGLDSVTVAVAAAANARRRGLDAPLALSFFFPNRLREEQVQRAVADRLDLEQVYLEYDAVAGRGGMLREALATSASLELPLQSIWFPGYLKLARMGVERGSATLLTGRGGDEWLSMFPIVAADLMRSFEIRELFAHTMATVRASQSNRFRMVRSVLWNSGARTLLAAYYAAFCNRYLQGVRRQRLLSSHERRRFRRSSWLLPDPALVRLVDRRDRRWLEESLSETPLPEGGFRHDIICGMLDNPLFAPSFEEGYEQGRLAGAMNHDIFWEPELIEFLNRVPPRLLYRGGQQKGLVRHDLARRFPDLGFERQKKLRARGFVEEVLLAEAGAAWREMAGARALGQLGIVDPKLLDSHVQGVLAGKETNRLGEIWQLMRLESWVRPRV